MLKEQNAFFQAVNTLIDNKLKKVKFNSYVDGVIQQINTDGTYKVKINGTDYDNVLSKYRASYQVGDSVQILLKNGDFNKKMIDGHTYKATIDTIYTIGSVYKTINNSNNPSSMLGGEWELVSSQYIDTGWQEYKWKNSKYINNSEQSAYTDNKWRVKNNVLYIKIGVGSTPSNMNIADEVEIAEIPIKGNASFNSAETRIWTGAVGGGGAFGGFFVRQDTNYATSYIAVYMKPHRDSTGTVGHWFSGHFVIPLDEGATITKGSYDKEYIWKKIK